MSQEPEQCSVPVPLSWDMNTHWGFVPPAFCPPIFTEPHSRFLSSPGQPYTFIFFLGHISIVLLQLLLPCPPKRASHTSFPTLWSPQLPPSLLPWTDGALTPSVNLLFPEALFSLQEFNGLIIAIPLRKSSSLCRNPSHPGLNPPCTDFFGLSGYERPFSLHLHPEYRMGKSTNPWLQAPQRMDLLPGQLLLGILCIASNNKLN